MVLIDGLSYARRCCSGVLEILKWDLFMIEFMGEITAGRAIFGPDNAEPILGVTALESVGITINPANRTLKRLPAIPLKRTRLLNTNRA
jgi:hypothetical protein